MKQNVRLIISYDGTRYKGWQKQESVNPTIQEILEEQLKKATGEEVRLHGSGRTDAGVHARGQTANFLMEKDDELLKDLRFLMNQGLPDDIRVMEAKKAGNHFQARKSAVGKIYSYTIWHADYPPVFERKYVCQMEEKPDPEKLEKAIPYLLGKHDFRGFSAEKRQEKQTIRVLTDIKLDVEKEKLLLTFQGNGFLYKMARILTGTLIEIGLGKRGADSIEEIFQEKKREYAGFTAPAQGLCLEKVLY